MINLARTRKWILMAIRHLAWPITRSIVIVVGAVAGVILALSLFVVIVSTLYEEREVITSTATELASTVTEFFTSTVTEFFADDALWVCSLSDGEGVIFVEEFSGTWVTSTSGVVYPQSRIDSCAQSR